MGEGQSVHRTAEPAVKKERVEHAGAPDRTGGKIKKDTGEYSKSAQNGDEESGIRKRRDQGKAASDARRMDIGIRGVHRSSESSEARTGRGGLGVLTYYHGGRAFTQKLKKIEKALARTQLTVRRSSKREEKTNQIKRKG